MANTALVIQEANKESACCLYLVTLNRSEPKWTKLILDRWKFLPEYEQMWALVGVWMWALASLCYLLHRYELLPVPVPAQKRAFSSIWRDVSCFQCLQRSEAFPVNYEHNLNLNLQVGYVAMNKSFRNTETKWIMIWKGSIISIALSLHTSRFMVDLKRRQTISI